jgi:hypothetical protein
MAIRQLTVSKVVQLLLPMLLLSGVPFVLAALAGLEDWRKPSYWLFPVGWALAWALVTLAVACVAPRVLSNWPEISRPLRVLGALAWLFFVASRDRNTAAYSVTSMIVGGVLLWALREPEIETLRNRLHRLEAQRDQWINERLGECGDTSDGA